MLLAHEFFDALPINVFEVCHILRTPRLFAHTLLQKRSEGWREALVAQSSADTVVAGKCVDLLHLPSEATFLRRPTFQTWSSAKTSFVTFANSRLSPLL